MLISHLDPPVVPGELWSSWNLDIPLCLALTVALVAGRRQWAFVTAIVTLAVALVSPLDALSSSLASAHMVQHLLLTTVAAPLLALALLKPFSDHTAIRKWIQNPVAWAVLHAAVLWCWHAGGLYEAALRNDLLHRLEHVTFILTAVVAWAAILRRGTPGLGVLVLFGLSVQSGLLGVLMTFAPAPWYPTYAGRTEPWGLSPLADQQLAGVIMWVPGGGAYLVAALVLLTSLVGEVREDVAAPT